MILCQLQIFCNPRGHCAVWTQGLEPWAQEGFPWEESVCKGAAVWNSVSALPLVFSRAVSMESISATLSWLNVRQAKGWRMVNLFCPVGLYKEYSNDLISQQSCFQRSFQMPSKDNSWHNFHLIFFFLKRTVHSWLQAFHAYLGVNTINLELSNVFTSINVSFDYYSLEKRYLIL